MTQIALYRDGEKIGHIELITAGFDAAYPFYSKLNRNNGEIRKLFYVGGWQGDLPSAIEGNNKSPSGRVINRRVEISLGWETAKTNTLTEKQD